jgi:hypothetical protein
MGRALWLASCVLLLRAGGVGAQESYTIRLKGAGEGETTCYEDTLTAEMRSRQVNALGGAGPEHRERTVRCTNYRETLLQIDPATRQPLRFRRECERATLEVNGKGSVLPFHGKSFVVERGAAGCRVQFEGTTPPAEFVRELEQGFGRKPDADPLQGMLPRKAVQVGETWTFDPRALLIAWPKPPQVRVDHAKATGTGKLARVYRQGERLFGVLEFQVEAPVVGVEWGSRHAEPQEGTRLAVRLTVDGCIDGGAGTFALQMVDELTAHADLPGPSGQRIRTTITEEHLRRETRR